MITCWYGTASAQLYINEFLSAPESGEQEWIEIYNSGSGSVNLSGASVWSNDKQKHTFESGDVVSATGYFLQTLWKRALANGWAHVELRDASGSIIDTVEYGTDAIPSLEKWYSLGRIPDAGDSWVSYYGYTGGLATPGQSNTIDFLDGIVLSGRGYSISGSDISVYWEQSQSFAGIEYLVDIDRCVSGTCALLSENISGTGIFLDTGATVYTDLSYTLSPVWTVSGSYISVEAITEEVFVWQSVPLWVSEVYANPTGSDTGYEWIELYNAGVQSYAMEDMYLSLSNSDGVDAFYWNLDFSDLIFYEVVPEYIQPGEYIIIPLVWFDGLEDAYFWQEFSASNLSNSAGWLELFYQWYSVDTFSYDITGEDQSWIRNFSSWASIELFDHPTPGEENTWVNAVPVAQVDLQGNAEFSTSGVVVLGVENGSINITGENSTDPDGDILYYDWDFGNGSVLRGTGSSFNNPLEISYTGSGLYDITLTVSDSYGGSSSTGITVELLKNQVPVPSWNLQWSKPSWDIYAGYSLNLTGDGTVDPDQWSNLYYSWDFGDGFIYAGFGTEYRNPNAHTYDVVWDYSVTYCVTDQFSAETCLENIVSVTQKPSSGWGWGSYAAAYRSSVSSNHETQISHDTWEKACTDIQITEIFPNPDGPDKGKEYIELLSKDSQPCSIKGWYFQDEKKGKKYTVKESQLLDPNTYFLYYTNGTTKWDQGVDFSLINKDGKYCLYDTEDIQHSCVSYRTATENISWTRNPLTNRFRKERTSPERKEFLSEDFIECQVDRVIDGDTFICSNNEQWVFPVRMIGIDTPETVDPRKTVQYFGIEASRYSKEKLTEAQVRIEFDQDIFDRYYRILGYVYLDSVLYNQKILEDGYAFAYTKYPFEKMEPFRQAEIFARENELGLWAPVSDQQQDRVVSEYMTNTQEKTKEEKQSLKQEKEQRKEDQEVSLVTKIKETILSDWLDTEIEHTQKSISKKTKSLSSQGLIHTNKVIRKKISNIAEIIFSNEKQDIEIEGIITKVLDSKHAYFAAGNRVFRLDAIGRDLGNIWEGDQVFLTGKYWKTKEGLTIKLYKRDTIEVLSKSVADIRPEPIVDPEQVTLSETDLFKDFSLTQSIEEKTAWSFQLGNIEVSRPDGVIVEKWDILDIHSARAQYNSVGRIVLKPEAWSVEYKGEEVDLIHSLFE